MATLEQIDANRRNAQHSTGPVTETGRQISSRNAITHGLTSTALIAPGESPAAFEALRTDTLAALAPTNEYERTLAENVATALWRYSRIQRYETAYWELQFRLAHENLDDAEEADPEAESETGDNLLNPNLVAASLFADPLQARYLSLVHRYLTTAERACTRATAAYEKACAARQTRVSDTPQSDAGSHAAADSPSAPQPFIFDEDRLGTMSTEEFNALLASMRGPNAQIPMVRQSSNPMPSTGFDSQKPRAQRRAEERARRKAERKALRQLHQLQEAA